MNPITTWDGVTEAYSQLSKTKKRWLFRGQARNWPLSPSLERILDRFKLPIDKLRDDESYLLREFKRHFHRYSVYMPSAEAHAEWLTLMQHHGAPTRLLDWTYSFHVALFFAVESAKIGSTCYMWAVDNDFLVENEKEVVSRFSEELKKVYEANDKDNSVLNELLYGDENLILGMNPFKLNERLAVQQGAFLFSQSKSEAFPTTFKRLRQKRPDAFRKFQIVCSKDLLVEAFKMLRSANISRVSLFPGLDGFAQSFNNLLLLENPRRYLRGKGPARLS